MTREDSGSALSVFAAASEKPDRLAVLGQGLAWSWADLADRVEERSQQLSRIPTHGDEIEIALLAQRSVHTLLWAYALLAAQRPFVLLHPAWTPRERQDVVERTGVSTILDSGEVHRTATTSATCSPPSTAAFPRRPACVVFTSGTSSGPRGVVLSGAALVSSALASAENLGWQESDRWLLNLPLAHVGGLSVLTRTLQARSTLVLDDADGFRACEFLQTVERHRATLLSLVPTMLQRVLEATGSRPATSVRAVLLGGAKVNPDLVLSARRAGWPLLLTYGMTETCSQFATQQYAKRFDEDVSALRAVGAPLGAAQARIRNDAGRPVAPGTVGALEVRGPFLMEGYIAAHESAAGRGALGAPGSFDADGWFATGDYARQHPGGDLEIVDRRTDLIISGGENVFPSEVEGIIGAHPAVEECCVVGLADDEWGQRVACAVVLRDGAASESALESLQSWVAERLSAFKRPRVWRAVSDLPRRPGLSKVDRVAVVESFRNDLQSAGDRLRRDREHSADLE